MRPFDRGIEIQFALRNMANCALVIADLRPSRVINAGARNSRRRGRSRKLRGWALVR